MTQPTITWNGVRIVAEDWGLRGWQRWCAYIDWMSGYQKIHYQALGTSPEIAIAALVQVLYDEGRR